MCHPELKTCHPVPIVIGIVSGSHKNKLTQSEMVAFFYSSSSLLNISLSMY